MTGSLIELPLIKFLLERVSAFAVTVLGLDGATGFGLAGFNFNDIQSTSAKHYLNSALGNKMFDYLSAGIPVLTFNANAMSDFVKLNADIAAYCPIELAHEVLCD